MKPAHIVSITAGLLISGLLAFAYRGRAGEKHYEQLEEDYTSCNAAKYKAMAENNALKAELSRLYTGKEPSAPRAWVTLDTLIKWHDEITDPRQRLALAKGIVKAAEGTVLTGHQFESVRRAQSEITEVHRP